MKFLLIATAVASFFASSAIAQSDLVEKYGLTSKDLSDERSFNKVFESAKAQLMSNTPDVNCSIYTFFCTITRYGQGMTITETQSSSGNVIARWVCGYSPDQTEQMCANSKGAIWTLIYNAQTRGWQYDRDVRHIWPR
jgi:hypothetical protein